MDSSSNLKLQERACAHNTRLDVDVNLDLPVGRDSIQVVVGLQKPLDVVDAVHLSVTRRILRLVDGVATRADHSSANKTNSNFSVM